MYLTFAILCVFYMCAAIGVIINDDDDDYCCIDCIVFHLVCLSVCLSLHTIVWIKITIMMMMMMMNRWS